MNGRLAVLENRINRLEQMIDGVGAGYDESMKVCKIPIAEAVEDLRMRVQLLHPAHVDGLHSRITQLLSKLQQVFFYVNVIVDVLFLVHNLDGTCFFVFLMMALFTVTQKGLKL